MSDVSSTARQRFSIGYHANTWDEGGRLEDCFGFLAEAGFTWFEALVSDSLSSYFARRHMTLGNLGPPMSGRDTDLLHRLALFSRAQQELGLRVSSLYVNAEFVNPALWPHERDTFHAVARFLAGCGSPVLVCGGGPGAARDPHADDDYRTFAEALGEVGRHTAELGVATVYHPHLDCFVETRDELDRLMEIVDTDAVGLCVDTGHLTAAGADVVDVIRTYAETVRYLHLKDVRSDVESLTGWDRYLAFCELGAGQVDFPGVVDALVDSGYDGLTIIELDVSQRSAEDSCRASLHYVTEVLGLDLEPG